MALSHVEECNFENYHNDYVQWMENLFRIGGDKYAIQTIEFVLSMNYQLQELWKCYIGVLRTRNYMKVCYV